MKVVLRRAEYWAEKCMKVTKSIMGPRERRRKKVSLSENLVG
jgi:hypothetical protein